MVRDLSRESILVECDFLSQILDSVAVNFRKVVLQHVLFDSWDHLRRNVLENLHLTFFLNDIEESQHVFV